MKRVLFACTQNSGRSIMAEAYFNRLSPAGVRAESAGTQPAAHVQAELVEVMREVGVDVSKMRPTKLLPEMQLHADWAITLACGASCPFVPTVVEDWDVPDPAGRTVDEVRVIRDQIELRVQNLIECRLDAIRADRTAEELRLQRLLPRLIRRFPELPEREVRSCADAVLTEFADVPVRSFVLTLAERRARACLASGDCRTEATTAS